MLYTIQKLPEEPIVIVRVLPPLSVEKQIFAIDVELARMSQQYNTKLYRIDDLTRLHPHQFTLTDALAWFTGSVREDALWRNQMPHVAVCRKKTTQMLATFQQAGITVHLPTFTSMTEAVAQARAHIGHR